MRKTIAKHHERKRNIRKKMFENLALIYVRNYDVVCIETLDMSELARKKLGRFGKSVGKVGWDKFVQMLERKGEQYGCKIIKADKYFPSSKTCLACGHIEEELPYTLRSWTCPECGVKHDRDKNAAQNLKQYAINVIEKEMEENIS